MQPNFLTVDILDAKFTIKSGSDPHYLGAIVEYLKGKIAEIEQAASAGKPTAQSKDALKIALLASLNIIDELFQARKLSRQPDNDDSRELEKITEQLIQRIDESLVEY
jgi:cell division protein ZapA (FtsZ GTPase activity inhibitor)